MDVTKLPFNEFIGLKFSTKNGYLLMLENKPMYRNHLNTVHASAQFALAEATGGYFLLNELSLLTDVVPVVRKAEVKYRKSVTDALFSKAKFQDIEKEEIVEALVQKGKILLKVEVSLYDNDSNLVMQSVFEWFMAKSASR
jgi:acyl-coenzyme A thioesterase PaaI-like protein